MSARGHTFTVRRSWREVDTLASAVAAGRWTALWVYLVAPPAGMLAAAWLWERVARRRGCAKLVHIDDEPCVFCGQEPSRDASISQAWAV